MNIKDAITIFSKTISGKKVIGYWISKKGFILNTKSIPEVDGFYGPEQFVVTVDGKVYGTNPLIEDFDILPYKKL